MVSGNCCENDQDQCIVVFPCSDRPDFLLKEAQRFSLLPHAQCTFCTLLMRKWYLFLIDYWVKTRPCILSSHFNGKITPNIISCWRGKSAKRPVSIGNCIKNIISFIEIRPIRARKNDYTQIWLFSQQLPKIMVNSPVWYVSKCDWIQLIFFVCAILFYHCRSFDTPRTTVASFVVVVYSSKLGQNWQMP